MSKRLSMMGIALLVIAIIYSACAGPAPAPAATEAPAQAAAPATTEASAATTTEAAAAAPAAQAGSRLDTVKERGKLICGVNNQLPGFGELKADGSFSGFDVDFCKAVAAAILGDANAVEYKQANSNDRFTLVKTGEIDVLFRNSTWTTTRDSAEVGMEFMPVNFYDGQGMMVRADSGITSIEDMDGATICVQSGTTTELNLADYFRARGLDFEPVVFDDNDKTLAAYDEGRCDGFTTDKSGLVASLTKTKDPAANMILADTMSKEPLAGAVAQGDPVWADVVRWAVFGLIQAEESGVTSANVQEMLASEDPTIKRLLGVEGELGAKLGLPNDYMVKVLEQVGNYGEIWDRNLGPNTPFKLPRGLNDQWTNGGLLYSPPFR
ncbi:MAG: amino acid ABC transporter substrate-binding protein [Anaerolineales bacterium]|nr:amino acid ABC transporter substrate-binding protein [Anaerolineales bacterium]